MVESSACCTAAANHVCDFGAGEEGHCPARTVGGIQIWIEYYVLGVGLTVVVRGRQFKTRFVTSLVGVVQTVFEIEP